VKDHEIAWQTPHTGLLIFKRIFMSDDLEHLKQWVGRKETMYDLATAYPVAALTATLDRRDPQPMPGDTIPPGWHWLYFLETKPASDLAHDGHAKRGDFLPPVTLPRRMWAGGRIEFMRPIRIGDEMTRESEILSVEPKSGKSGSLVFVTVRHTVIVAGETAVVEEHDIVYREAAKPGESAASGKPAPTTAAWRRELIADEVTLFRYSALIFNAHRIHYDLDYCKNDEHYPGLIVHGPLQTTLLLDLSRRHEPRPVRKLDYRAQSPLFHTDRFSVNGNPAADGASAQLWTGSPAGHYAMTAKAHY
jgi:3-methylfumaryl-CoA hydratase